MLEKPVLLSVVKKIDPKILKVCVQKCMCNCKPNIVSPIQIGSEQMAVDTFNTLPPPATIPFVRPNIQLMMNDEISLHRASVERNHFRKIKSMQQDNYRNGFRQGFSQIRTQLKSSNQDDLTTMRWWNQ